MATFFRKCLLTLHRAVLGKNNSFKIPNICEVNFALKAQNFTTGIREKSAVLDAVLEDKPAQPLPCGSYLVLGVFEKSIMNVTCHYKRVGDNRKN